MLITTLFWDVGGVILTNGWDRSSRQAVAQLFGLDGEEFEDRHQRVVDEFERGRLTLEEYLQRTVFYRPRPHSEAEFQTFMFAQSRPYPEAMAIADALARSGKYLMATINNESRPLNLYRIREFGLRRFFTVFFSSCFLGVRKPDEAIYRLALNLAQRDAETCLYIDDRLLNLECAARCGLRPILHQNPDQLREALLAVGVEGSLNEAAASSQKPAQ